MRNKATAAVPRPASFFVPPHTEASTPPVNYIMLVIYCG